MNIISNFRLHKLAFAVEISLGKARNDGSEIRIKYMEGLLQVLTDVESFGKVVDQGAESYEASEYIGSYLK